MINKKPIWFLGISFFLFNCGYFSIEIYKEIIRSNLSVIYGENIAERDYLRLSHLNDVTNIFESILIVVLLVLVFWFIKKKQFVYFNHLILINLVTSITFLILGSAVSMAFKFSIGNLTQFYFSQLVLTFFILIIQKICYFFIIKKNLVS